MWVARALRKDERTGLSDGGGIGDGLARWGSYDDDGSTRGLGESGDGLVMIPHQGGLVWN